MNYLIAQNNTIKTNANNTNTVNGNIGRNVGTKVVVPAKIKDPFDGSSLLGVGTKFINFLLAMIVIAAVVVIVIAGFRMITGGGNPTQVAKAKKAIIYAIIGLAVALMSFAIVQIIQRFLER